MMKMLLTALVLSLVLVFNADALGQAPNWVRHDLRSIAVEQASASVLQKDRFQGFVEIPSEIKLAIPERNSGSGPRQNPLKNVASTTANQGSTSELQTHRGVDSPVTANHSVYPADPAPRLSTSAASSNLHTDGCASGSGYGNPHRPLYSPTLISPPPVSQITKRSFAYGDFGAQSNRPFSSQTGSTHSRTTWSW